MNDLTYHPTLPSYVEKYGTKVVILSNRTECAGQTFIAAKTHAARVINKDVKFIPELNVSEARVVERSQA